MLAGSHFSIFKANIKFRGISIQCDPGLSKFKSPCLAALENHLPYSLEAGSQALLPRVWQEADLCLHAYKLDIVMGAGREIPELLSSLLTLGGGQIILASRSPV